MYFYLFEAASCEVWKFKLFYTFIWMLKVIEQLSAAHLRPRGPGASYYQDGKRLIELLGKRSIDMSEIAPSWVTGRREDLRYDKTFKTY
jgi:hypothetical protein